MSNYQQITNTHLSAHSTKLDDIVTNTASFSTTGLALEEGKSTSALQTAGNTHLSKLRDSLFLDGAGISGTSEGQLIMGRDNNNNAHPLHITSNGDLEVEIADFVKGQTTASASFPVVLANDQSALDVDNVELAKAIKTDGVSYSYVNDKGVIMMGVDSVSGNNAVLNTNGGKLVVVDSGVSTIATNTSRAKTSGSVTFSSSTWTTGTYSDSVDMADHSDIGFSFQPTSGSDTFGDVVEILVSDDDVNYYPMGDVFGRDFNSASGGCWNSSFENKWRYVKFYLHSTSNWTISSMPYSLSNQ